MLKNEQSRLPTIDRSVAPIITYDMFQEEHLDY
jgi:hypothetical protein